MVKGQSATNTEYTTAHDLFSSLEGTSSQKVLADVVTLRCIVTPNPEMEAMSRATRV
jgi:hypothetical protein